MQVSNEKITDRDLIWFHTLFPFYYYSKLPAICWLQPAFSFIAVNHGTAILFV